MKLVYGQTTLGDDDEGDFITDLGGPHGRVVQQDPLAFGSAPFLAGRSNHTNQRSFVVAKEHADLATAVEWFNAHPDTLEEQGELRVTQGDATWTMTAALVAVERLDLTGVSTQLRYTFTGGQITEAV